MRTAVVVPTCRSELFADWWRAWEPHFGPEDELLIIEDAPKRSFVSFAKSRHYAHADIEAMLGNDAWIISRRDSAIRAFGFLLACREHYGLIVTIDDDCFPTEHFTGRTIGEVYRDAMRLPAWQESIPSMRTRGLPYGDLGERQSDIHMGLWRNVPDLDAVSTLASGSLSPAGFHPPSGNRLMSAWQYFPLCGMNLACTEWAAPLMYFALMGYGQPYRRFDDIWFGIIAQRICRHLNMPLSVGEPHVEHRRASDPFVNLVKESPGIAANEKFWRVVDECELRSLTPLLCMREMGEHLVRQRDEYLSRLGRAILTWVRLLSEH